VTPTLSIEDAAQVLRPPADGLAYLRHDRAGELTLEPGSVALDAGLIAGFEPDAGAEVRIDASGCAVVPGFVDCHTHLPFAGWRSREYAMKVAGASYEEITRAGGGIRSSARTFAALSDDDVLAQAGALAAQMLTLGTTTFETKTGYGLSRDAELRALRLGRELAGHVVQDTTATALLAHVVPEGFEPDGWMDVVEGMIDEARAIAEVTALDIYVESVAFTNEHLRRMGALARRHGLDLRAHVEQFSTNRSVPVALEAGARSVDHLSCLPDDEIGLLAAAECAAVLLPGAEFMGRERIAPGRELADAGTIGVLATDLNPGTSPITSLPLIMGLAVRRYGWSVREALLAVTLNAAWVLRRSDVAGSLEVGKRADVLVLDGPAEHIPYRLGNDPVLCVICNGELRHVRPGAEVRVQR
jgi:imidazolonepropionase